MISGVFRDGHSRLTVTVHGKSRPQEIEFVVDTGFEGDLALPGQLVSALGLMPAGVRRRRLANGAVINCRYYRTEIELFAGTRPAEVLHLEGMALLGTALLDDHMLQVEVTEGGEVLVEPL